MHIEPGVVDGAKIALSYATAAASFGLIGKMALDTIRHEGGAVALGVKAAAASVAAFAFFEVLPHFSAGVSEVHFILGSSLLLLLGAGPAAIGMAVSLLAQGLLMSPADLPQYTVNLTTLIVPLFAMSVLAKRIIPARTAYVDVSYRQTLALSAAFQGGVVAWVAFWVIWGQGMGAATVASIGTFAAAYAVVVVAEPLADLGMLAIAKAWGRRAGEGTGSRAPAFLNARLYRAA